MLKKSILLILLLTSCKPDEQIMNNPPIANKIPTEIKLHGEVISDPYAWLRDPKWPNVTDQKILSYLTAENEYYNSFFAPLQIDKDKIFHDLKAMIKLSDQSTYIKQDDYYYYSRTEEDKDYPIYCRKYKSVDAPEEVLLDVNQLAVNKSYTRLGSFSISPDHKLLAYSIDFSGDEKFTIKVFDTKTKQLLTDEIPNTISNIIWHENQQGFFYTKLNDQWRNDKVYFHKLGTIPNEDILVLHEPDPLYNISLSKSASKQYLYINIQGHNTNEIYVLDFSANNFTLKLFRPKQEQVFYELEHHGEHFYIHTNDNAKNFKISRTQTNDFAKWEDYISEDQEAYLSNFSVTNNYLLLDYQKQALPITKVHDFNTKQFKDIKFPDNVFVASIYSTNFIEDDIRVNYSSLARPNTTYNYNYPNDKLEILKIQEIPSGFNPEEYHVEREWADNNGIKIPISLMYKKSLFKKDGTNPVYLYGYGSYGIGMSASFRNKAIQLANKGFIFAIAHIRGGDELGKYWHDEAKFLHKKRTFEDFIKSAEHLIEKKYTSKGNITIVGGSAGGMLIGTVINDKPELFKVAVAHVPFVDVLNTMLDETLPLTPGEFKEWGNPKDKEYFDYIRSYSPYDNVKAQNYPSLFVTAGLSDPRVGYWEAAKWVAKLRANKTNNNIILLKTNMDAGHRGASGRFDYLKEEADEMLFIYKMFNIPVYSH